MKLGIIGLEQAGKATVFEALTGTELTPGARTEPHIGTIRVPDMRVDTLSGIYKPRKTIYAQVEYFLPAGQPQSREKRAGEQPYWTQVRDCDALIHCVRNFDLFGSQAPRPHEDYRKIDQELIFEDLIVVEKRLERLELDQKRGKKADPEELTLLNRGHELLENERPLREDPEIAAARKLRGFAFLSAKPQLALFNNADEDDGLPAIDSLAAADAMVIRGKLEQELARMTPEEAAEFQEAFGLGAAAAHRTIQRSYALLGLISFFTVGEDEVRAWTIRCATPAVDAAEVIHSDIKKGFIRAEVLAYADLMAAGGNYAEARKQGTTRLEGKSYEVQDGDIINFRFNV